MVVFMKKTKKRSEKLVKVSGNVPEWAYRTVVKLATAAGAQDRMSSVLHWLFVHSARNDSRDGRALD